MQRYTKEKYEAYRKEQDEKAAKEAEEAGSWRRKRAPVWRGLAMAARRPTLSGNGRRSATRAAGGAWLMQIAGHARRCAPTVRAGYRERP
jgi:hypothetical protein